VYTEIEIASSNEHRRKGNQLDLLYYFLKSFGSQTTLSSLIFHKSIYTIF
jgi:hypothetical protein